MLVLVLVLVVSLGPKLGSTPQVPMCGVHMGLKALHRQVVAVVMPMVVVVVVVGMCVGVCVRSRLVVWRLVDDDGRQRCAKEKKKKTKVWWCVSECPRA